MSVSKVRGIRASAKNTILTEALNINRAKNALPAGSDTTPYRNQLDRLLDQAAIINEMTISALNALPNLPALIDDLDGKALDAKKEAESFANATKTVAQITATVGKVETVVEKIADLVL